MENNNIPEYSSNGTRKKILFLFILLLVIALVIGVRSYQRSVHIKENNLIISCQKVNFQIKDSVIAFATRYEDLANTLGNNDSVSNHTSSINNAAQILKCFDDAREKQTDIMSIYLGDIDKKMLLSPQQELPQDYDPTIRPWYKDAVANGDFIWTDPYSDVTNSNIIVSCAKPVYDANKNLVGVLGIDLNLKNLVEKINTIQSGKKGNIIITDKNGTVMMNKDRGLIGRPIGIKAITDGKVKSTSVIQYTREDSSKKNNPTIAIVTKVDKLEWYIVTLLDKKDFN